MTTTGKIATGLICAAIGATIATYLNSGSLFDPVLLALFAAATLSTAFIAGSSESGGLPDIAEDDNPDREKGEVKWFNVTKGFGFIIRENGEEIFVHFRSIRGEGRRGLRDGQTVSFVLGQSDKGPQAEDVEPL